MHDPKTRILPLAADFLLAVTASVRTKADARLVALADAYEALDRLCKEHETAHKHLTGEAAETEFDRLVERYRPIEHELAATPADTIVGVLAKARLCQVPMARSTVQHDHILSLADDIHRLFGEHHV